MKYIFKKRSYLDPGKTFVIKVNTMLIQNGWHVGDSSGEEKHSIAKRNVLTNVHATVT